MDLSFFGSAQIADENRAKKKARALLHSWSGIIFLPINYLAAICQTPSSIALRVSSASLAPDRSSSLQSARAERAVGLASFQAQSFRSFVVLRYSRVLRRFATVRVTYACVYRLAWWDPILFRIAFERQIDARGPVFVVTIDRDRENASETFRSVHRSSVRPRSFIPLKFLRLCATKSIFGMPNLGLSNCSLAIVLLSDGIVERHKSVLVDWDFV